ncbi:DUF1097 domain-containing protein [Arthrobacter sp. B6]|uniref:DUF1097 domain-containing protein n=1 Tax=Arthrobacter sp. B6 TaxID=1570137 RepID=UPI0008325264|nr:DUF1097 domain-containing protein [Arthrobacter sp. B6]
MKALVTIGISVGILAGLWTQFSTPFGLITWVGFVGWACYFAAGGKRDGLLKAIPATLSGALWGSVIVWTAGAVALPVALPIAVSLAAFAMCVQARWRVLSFIPGTFAGCAAFFGTSFDLSATCLALALGAGLGWLSEYAANLTTGFSSKREAPIHQGQPVK